VKTDETIHSNASRVFSIFSRSSCPSMVGSGADIRSCKAIDSWKFRERHALLHIVHIRALVDALADEDRPTMRCRSIEKIEMVTRHISIQVCTVKAPWVIRGAFAKEPVVRAFNYEQVCRRLYSSRVRVFSKSRRKSILVAQV
jgi:hypothetical protein